MTTPAKFLIRSTIGAGIAAGLCAALVLGPSAEAAGGKTQTLRFFDKPVSLTLKRPDGTLIRRPPATAGDRRTMVPQAGDVLDVVSLVYTGDHAKHAARPSGTTHLRCTFAASGPPDCVSHVALGSSMLVFQGNPGRVTLGTGNYLGATGRVLSSTQVGNDASDIVARITLR